jgi:AcrR family transcriptional regulator
MPVPIPRRGGRPPGRAPGLTRRTILAAATREFAARGYAAAGVDRIARRAGVNKAMIYYHFKSKAGLYRAILAGLFEPAGERARALAALPGAPEAKLDALVAMITSRVFAHPELPPIMMREIAEGARHLDRQMLGAMSGLYESVAAVVEEGQRAGRFEPVRPLLVYFTFIGPLILFLGGAPVRQAMSRLKGAGDWDCDQDALCAHLQRVLRRLLMLVAEHATGESSSRPRARHRPSAIGRVADTVMDAPQNAPDLPRPAGRRPRRAQSGRKA